MKRFYLKLTLSLLAMAIAIPTTFASNPKREHRSVWVTTAWGMCWPSTTGTTSSVATTQQNEAIQYLDLLQENGFNCVYFQVRSMSDAMYKSSYEPWSSYLTGSRGSTPAWDPLEFWVEECHKRGMECFAWVNPYRYESSVSGASWTGTNDYRTTNPDWILEYNNMSILNPGIEAVQTRIVDVCREIVSNYDIDGLVFDDYFYLNSIPNSYDATQYNASGSSLSQADWRRENVNTMVRKVNEMVKSVKPWVKFGISPAGVSKTSASKYGISTSSISSASDWQYSQIYSDPLAWLAEGTVDFISPQLYWLESHSTNSYSKLSKWWSDACANVFERHFYSSHSISFLAEANANTEANWAEVAGQIQSNRDYTGNDAPGCVLFGSRDLTGKRNAGLAPYLKEYSFQYLALPPTMTFKSSYASDPGVVTDLSLSGTTLSWTGHSNVRYAVYAVPDGVTVTDDVAVQYLIGVPYDTSFDVSGYSSGYQLGVSVVDRYGYEYTVAWLGGTSIIGALDRTTINTPTDGSTVDLGFTFGWTALADDVTYTLEVSTSSTFATVNFSATTTATSYASSNFNLQSGTTYYWRVKAAKTGYTSSTSWVGSFTTTSSGSTDPGTSTDVVKDPASYSSINGYSIESKWIQSVNTSNFPSNLTISNRGIAAYNGNVYVAQQGGTLLEFSGENGSLLRTITLTGDCLTSSSGTSLSYASNDVFVDGAGNLCVSNMTINTTTQPLTVCTVNLSTGATTRVFEMSLHSSSERIDYANVYGDVTASGGQVWAAVASSDVVYRWTRNASGTWTEASTTIGKYYSSGTAGSNNSTAPRIMPISTTQFILDPHNSAPSLYTFNASGTATYVDGFGSNTSLAPTADNWNGVCTATLGGTPIFIYVSSIAPNAFYIVTNPSNFSYAAMSKLWTVPANGLGSATNTAVTSQPAAINNADGSVTLFLYTPLNGLACYLLTSENTVTPELGAVALNSPLDGNTVSTGFDFAWSAIDGATYTIEISTSSTFSSTAFSATTTSNSYSSSNFSLTPGVTYYWRVKAAKDGYTSSTSSVEAFVIELPTLSAVTLSSPTGGVTVEDGFNFSWSAISGATYTLEISSLATFASVMYSVSSTTNSYSSASLDLADGTKYYWRVKASMSGYQSSTSSIESFSTPASAVVTPPTSDLPTEDEGYNEMQGLRIENLWIYSINEANFPEQLGSDQRGMAAYKGNLYISERADGAGYLLEFSGETGEYLRTIALSGDYLTLSDGNSLGWPCNDVFTDAAGNLCVANMITSVSSSSQLNVCTVDISTGKTTRVFESYLSNTTMRIDNCMVYGDITKAGAKIFAAPSGNNATSSTNKRRIYCWTRNYDHTSSTDVYEDWSSSYKSTWSYYPSSATNFGNAPRVLPLSTSRIIVDGAAIYPTLYQYGNYSVSIEDSFESNTAIRPTGMLSAGMCTATVNNKPLFIYSFNDNESEFFNFAIAYNPSDFDFAEMEILWTVPKAGLGNVGHSYVSSIPATIANADGSITLFIYTPNNGIAAYRIYDPTTSVESVFDEDDVKIKLIDKTVTVSEEAYVIEVFNTAGVIVANNTNSKTLDVAHLVNGVYIVRATTDNGVITESIVIK